MLLFFTITLRTIDILESYGITTIITIITIIKNYKLILKALFLIYIYLKRDKIQTMIQICIKSISL